MTPVPWVTLGPDEAERLVGVLLCRLHPDAIRLRPARGDGGVDVFDPIAGRFVDVFQIKSFATSLNSSRKGQITRSLQRVAENPTLDVRTWYLAMPLNPTPGDLEWFQRTTEQQSFACKWFGLDRLEALAAAYPDVVDYYIHDGRERLEASIALLRDVAGITGGPTSQLLAPGDVTASLAALYRTLNRDDPHYRYEFEVGEEPPPVAPLMERPWLVASCTVGSTDVAVTHHVYARYRMATEDAPIPLAFTVQRGRFDEATAEAWERAMTYGTSVELPAGMVTDLRIELPGGLTSAASEAAIRLSAARGPDTRPYRLRLRAINGAGEVVAEVLLHMEPATTGLRGGTRAQGSDSGGAFELEMLLGPTDETEQPGAHVSFNLHSLSGRPPAAVLPGVRFLGALHRPNRLQFAAEYGPPAAQTFEIATEEAPASAALVELVDALAELQQSLSGLLVIPELYELSVSDYRCILRAARLTRGETVEDEWEACEIGMTQVFESIGNEPVQLALGGEYRLKIGDQEIVVAPITIVLLAAQLRLRHEKSGPCISATPALGNNSRLMMRASIEDVPPRAVGRFGQD